MDLDQLAQRQLDDFGRGQHGLIFADPTIALTLADAYTRAFEHPDMYDLSEALIEFDKRVAIWRDVHVKMVQRVIGGGAIGTQGTPVAVLAGLTTHRLYPALWDVRNTLTELADL